MTTMAAPMTIRIVPAGRPIDFVATDHLEIENDEFSSAGPRKRKRLTHLSQEERLMRRKLKNRIAAQTARDRKKQRMDQLEEAIAQLQAENQELHTKNDQLRYESLKLAEQNKSLRSRLDRLEQDAGSASNIKLEQGVDLSERVCTESAALAGPPQQGRTQALIMTLLASLILKCKSLQKNSSVSSKKSVVYSAQQRRTLLSLVKRLENFKLSNFQHTTSPRMLAWWGPQQQSWNPREM